MAKFLYLFLLVIFFKTGKSDTIVQLIEPFVFNSSFINGCPVGFVITNTGNSTQTFYAKTVFDTGKFDHKFLSWQDYLKDIASEKQLIKEMNKIAYYEKSNRFKNQLVEFDDYDSKVRYLQNVVDHKYSILWFTSFSNHQCGSYRGMFNKTLIETGAISSDSIFEVSLNPKHQATGFILHGDSSIADPDPAEAVWLTKTPKGKYEWVNDFKYHKNYLKSNQLYTYCDPVNKRCGFDLAHCTVAQYQSLFENVAIKYYSTPHINNVADSSLFRLPPNSSLSWRLNAPRFIIDTSVKSVKVLLDSVLFCTRTNPSLGINLFARLLKTSVDTVLQFLTGNIILPILITNGKQLSANDVVLSPWFGSQYEFSVHINARPIPIIIGKDFMLPGWVHSITTDEFVSIGETVFPRGTTTVQLYVKNNFIGGGPADKAIPVLTPCAIQSGFIPANTTVDIVVGYNQLIYGFPDGLNALFFGKDRPDGLTVTKTP